MITAPSHRRRSARPCSRLRRVGPFALTALLGLPLLLPAPAARGGAYDWTGGGSNNNWSNSGNWLFGAPVSDLANTDVYFGNHPNYPNPYLESAYSIHSLNFSGDANGYAFSGQTLTVGVGGITQNSPNAQSFAQQVQLGDPYGPYQSPIFTLTLADGAGPLTFGGGLYAPPIGDNAFIVYLNANTMTGAGNVLNGNIGGSMAVAKTGPGVLTLTGTNNWISLTTGPGAVAFSDQAQLGTSVSGGGELRSTVTQTVTQPINVAIISAAPGTTVTYNNLQGIGRTTIFGTPGETGTVIWSGGLTGNDPRIRVSYGTLQANSNYLSGLASTFASVTVDAGATLDFDTHVGNVLNLLGAGTVTNANSDSALTIQGGNFAGNFVPPTRGLVKSGNSTLTLTGTSVFAAPATVSAGNLTIAAGSFQPGSLTVDGAPLAYAATTLSAGTIQTSSTYVGYSNTGTFTQTGGTHAFAGSDPAANQLYLGYNTGSSGTYTLLGGLLTAPSIDVGDHGAGILNLSATAAVSSTVDVAYFAGSTGTVTLNPSGVLQAGGGVVGGSGQSTLNFNGGTLRAAGDGVNLAQGLTTANVQAGGAVVDTNGHNAFLPQSLLHDTTSGAPALDGGLTKLGGGTLSLAGVNTYTGDTVIRGGTLSVASDAALGAADSAVDLFAGTALAFSGSSVTTGRTFNLAGGTLTPAPGGTLTYAGATINGGVLGAGSQILADGTRLTGTRTTNGTALSQSGGTVRMGDVLLTGNTTFTQAAGATLLTAGDFTANPLTTLTVNGRAELAGGYVSGSLTINAGGSVDVAGGLGGTPAPLYLDGGRGATVNARGQLNAGNSSVELGGLLVNNGSQSGTLNVNLGGVARGSGSFGTVHVGQGGYFGPNALTTGGAVANTNGLPVIHLTGTNALAQTAFVGPQLQAAPGTATVASLSLGSGSVFALSIQNAQEGAGEGYDTAHASGTLTLAAGTAAGSQITISVASLNSSGTAGQASGFDPGRNYTFALVTADGGISGYQAGEFVVDTSSFQNTTQGGRFSVVQQGNNLDLVFAAVPEPGTWALLSVGVVGLVTLHRRRCAVRR